MGGIPRTTIQFRKYRHGARHGRKSVILGCFPFRMKLHLAHGLITASHEISFRTRIVCDRFCLHDRPWFTAAFCGRPDPRLLQPLPPQTPGSRRQTAGHYCYAQRLLLSTSATGGDRAGGDAQAARRVEGGKAGGSVAEAGAEQQPGDDEGGPIQKVFVDCVGGPVGALLYRTAKHSTPRSGGGGTFDQCALALQ